MWSAEQTEATTWDRCTWVCARVPSLAAKTTEKRLTYSWGWASAATETNPGCWTLLWASRDCVHSTCQCYSPPGPDSPPATASAETSWIQELLEKHGIDDLYVSTVHTGTRGAGKRKRKGAAIVYESGRENGHYTRSKLSRELDLNRSWPQSANRQHPQQKRNHITTRGRKENNPSTLIISSSEDSISDDPDHNWDSDTSRISGSCTEPEVGSSSSDDDSDDLNPVRLPRNPKRRATCNRGSRSWRRRYHTTTNQIHCFHLSHRSHRSHRSHEGFLLSPTQTTAMTTQMTTCCFCITLAPILL